MRLGLRSQILLLLGLLLVVAFALLFAMTAGYASFVGRRVAESGAASVAHVVALELADTRSRWTPRPIEPALRGRLSAPPKLLERLLRARVGRAGVVALALYEPSGHRAAGAGPTEVLDALPEQAPPDASEQRPLRVAGGRAWLLVEGHPLGAIGVVARVEQDDRLNESIAGLMALYMGLAAVLVLVAAYLALTHVIVRPLDRMAAAAERVAGGARRLDVPQSGARELVELASSLETMTRNLLEEEAALRRKIDEVETATRRLEETRDQLIRSERLASVGRVAAGLAHEVGNPIAAMLGLEDLILAGGLTPEAERDFVARLRRETERIHHILRDLLHFARPQTTPSTSGPQAAGDLRQAIDESVALLRPQRAMHDVALRIEAEPNLPPVSLPTGQLVQVLLNLLLNAADASTPGGAITVRARRCAAQASGSPRDADGTAPGSEPGARVRLEVEDCGSGVAAGVRERLFEPFVTTKEIGQGTGLGLAVCRGLVESQGGSLDLDASYAAGARFVVELPIDRGHT